MISSFPELESLRMFIERFRRTDSVNFQKFGKGFGQLLRLRSLKLKLFALTVSETDIDGFINNISQSKHLEELQLIMDRFPNIKTRHFKVLGDLIEGSQQLKHLNIIVAGETIKSQDCSPLMKSIQHAQNLLSLDMKIDVRDEDAVDLAKSISYLQKLKNLSLSWGDTAGPESAQVLAVSLKNLKDLDSISISYSHNDKIRDMDVEAIINALKHLKYITTLEFKFYWCPEISQPTVINIMELVTRARMLKEFIVIVSNCGSISIEENELLERLKYCYWIGKRTFSL